MEATARPPRPLERGHLALVVALLALAALSWLVTGDRMEGMDAGPGTDPGSLGFYVTAWVVMMAAMMFPSIAPMVLAYAHIQRRRRERGTAIPSAATALFVGGYLLAWSAFGLVAYGVYVGVRELSIDWLSWDRAGPYVAGAVILGAAAYQLTPLKDVCLRHCRSPLDFVLGHFREGAAGALRMGVEHGAWCVGCCWGLMAALFALGVMSVGWMVFVAALIAIEKLLPWKALANRGIAALLVAVGVSVAFWPDRVPGLTVPGSAKANSAMERMQMAPARERKQGGGMEMEP